MNWERLKTLVLEALAVSALIGGLGFPAEWLRGRINNVVAAQESMAASLKSIAERK